MLAVIKRKEGKVMINSIVLAAEESQGGGASGIVGFIVVVLIYAGMWKMFEKAGEKGWKCLIPIYNVCIISKISTGSMVKWLLCLIPLAGIVFSFIYVYKLVKAYGHGIGFFFGVLFFPEIFYPIMGFGASEYLGPQ